MFVKSPIHYMGCKFDLLPYLIEQFPKKEDVSVFYDIFGGSATISMNVPYNKVIYNELDCNLCNILKMLKETKPEELVCHIKKRIEEFDLNNEGVDIRGKNVSEEIIKNIKINTCFLEIITIKVKKMSKIYLHFHFIHFVI